MKRVIHIAVLTLLPTILSAQPPDQTDKPAQPVVVENEPTVHVGNEPTVNIGNQPTVDVGNVVDVDAFVTNDSVPVDVINERIDVRVSPRTRAYTLFIDPPTNIEFKQVPFDSYITGVLFTATGISSRVCPVRLIYRGENVAPGGSDSNLIAHAPLHGTGDTWGDTEYIPVPNMFVGEDVELEFTASDASGLCSIQALVYLIPATTGITPPGGRIGLSSP